VVWTLSRVWLPAHAQCVAVDGNTDFCILIVMKTTLDLRDDLLARAKELAAKERTSLTKIIEESLAVRLRRQKALRGKLRELPLSPRTGGLRGGIDPSSNRALFDAADR
jgi:hypothetical protein